MFDKVVFLPDSSRLLSLRGVKHMNYNSVIIYSAKALAWFTILSTKNLK